MGTRLQRLLNELDEASKFSHRVCPHGGVLYPTNWNTKTRQKAVVEGELRVCECEPKFPYLGWQYLMRTSSV
jgi:hypothetical protein